MRAIGRLVLPAALLVCLGGCSSSNSDWKNYFQLVRAGLHGGFGSTSITREQAAAIPYASLGYRVNGGSEAILVLATDTNGDQLWTAASHVVLLIRGGRIVRSVGLPHDRTAMTPQGSGELPALADAIRAPYGRTRIVDMPDIGAYGVPLACLTTAKGAQTITILGAALATVRVDETCQSANPRWSFTDNYWLDAKTGFAWHSIQHLSVSGSTVQIEILRPPG